jgi:hypothetical protein
MGDEESMKTKFKMQRSDRTRSDYARFETVNRRQLRREKRERMEAK